jgi:hypothetical protein
MTTAKEIIEYMESLRNEEQRENLMRFFKTAPGEYGYPRFTCTIPTT